MREAWKATLATVARSGGHPYGSLVAVATEPDGSPLLLLSGLAEHTKNLSADRRASILFDGTGTARGALTGARVTVVGRIVEATDEPARHRYLARHPDAAGFIGFADFRLYALRIEWAHLVAGFGRIVRLDARDVTLDPATARSLAQVEPGILAHMNEDHANALALLAGRELRARQPELDVADALARTWSMVGCDPEGFDLAGGESALRILFPEPVTTPDAVRKALVTMVQAARTT